VTFHIVHLFQHAGRLGKQRGRLVFDHEGGQESLPIENVRAVIVAAKGISMSSQVVGALLKADCIILHCDQRYQPVGWTLPCDRTIHRDLLEGQVRPRGGLHRALWRQVVARKVWHQAMVLDRLDIQPNPLWPLAQSPDPSQEGNAARMYFRRFFPAVGAVGQNRTRRHQGWANDLLNYGYAVLAAMIHRSIIVHGLLSQVGIHHRMRYRSYPLVYDLMEPWRPLVDAFVVGWAKAFIARGGSDLLEDSVQAFGRHVGQALRDYRVDHRRYSLKMVDAVDLYVRSVAKSMQLQSAESLWLPQFDLSRVDGFYVSK
jgi:CRISP-associated protein Cas1